MQRNKRQIANTIGYLAIAWLSVVWLDRPAHADDKLPSGEEIMDTYVKRSGGEEAYARIKNRVTKGQAETFRGAMGRTIYTAEPNKQYVELESPNGLIRRGANGEVVWGLTQSGAWLRKDEMRKRALVETFFHMPDKWRELCTKAECKGIVEIDGKKCYKVELSTIYDFPLTYYIDVHSMLLQRAESTSHGDGKQHTFGRNFSDYKEVDGILYPHAIERTVNGKHRVTITIQSIEHNVDLPAGFFDLPQEVADLVEQERNHDETPE